MMSDRGQAPCWSEAERFNHAAWVFEERSRELCMSSIVSRATIPGDIHGDFEVFQIVCVTPAATG